MALLAVAGRSVTVLRPARAQPGQGVRRAAGVPARRGRDGGTGGPVGEQDVAPVRPVTDGRTSFGVLLAQFGDIAATTQQVIDAQQRQLGAILDRAAQVARTVADPEAAAYEVAAGQRRPVPRVPAGRVGSRLGPVPPARPVPVHDRGRGAGHDLPRGGCGGRRDR
jgi:hypothetical protein